MPGQGPGLAPRHTRETYEAKCERHQEARESRRWRPNMTTCRLAQQVSRAWYREQLKGARQHQLFCRRRLDQPEAVTDYRQGVHENMSLQEQLPGNSSGEPPTQHLPPTGVLKYLAKPPSPQTEVIPTPDNPMKQPVKLHCGTQTLVETAVAPGRSDASQQTNCGVAVLDKEILQLSEYLKEALQRELVLKQKMVLLQDLLTTLVQASQNSWMGQLNEDKLKGRLHTLESQLRTCTQKASPWGLKKALMELEEQKSSYEQKARESLQRVLEEKMGAEQQLESAQRSLAQAKQQCVEWRERYESLHKDWSHLQGRQGELEQQLQALKSRMQVP